MKKVLSLALILLAVNQLTAEIKLPAILSDHMVLQQRTAVRFWGMAKERSKVTITTGWNQKIVTTQADALGNWTTTVQTPEAGGPYQITISDGTPLILKDVLIGEVWLCSGQSNMEMPMRGFDRQPVAGSQDVIARAKASRPIRLFSSDFINGKKVHASSKQPLTQIAGSWLDNSPTHVADFSAVGYHFAQYLQEVLEVPVGVIVSSLGGSSVEAWMSRPSLAAFPSVNLSMLDDTTSIKTPNQTPTVLFNAKMAPLIPFTIKGMLWYQGESNRRNADQYTQMMATMVSDWRARWGQGDFPFYYVQIAPYNYEGADSLSAAKLRESQQEQLKVIPNSGMVTTMDIGHPRFIHPVDKKTVGTRLAWWALGHTYGKPGIYYHPPIYKSMEVKGNKIYIQFAHAEQSIQPMWTDLSGFEIAGADKVFYPAKATIETSTTKLAVMSDRVPVPVAVRYAYKNFVEASIFSVSGIPVSPFRTDNW